MQCPYFWYVALLLSFNSKCFLIPIVIFSLTHELFRKCFLKFQIYDDLLVIIFLTISLCGHCAQICEPLFNFSASWPLPELVVDPRGMAPNTELLTRSLSPLRSSPGNSLHCLVDSPVLSNFTRCSQQKAWFRLLSLPLPSAEPLLMLICFIVVRHIDRVGIGRSHGQRDQ